MVVIIPRDRGDVQGLDGLVVYQDVEGHARDAYSVAAGVVIVRPDGVVGGIVGGVEGLQTYFARVYAA